MSEVRETAISGLLREARTEYARSLASKVARIEELFAHASWTEVRREAHKLAGSAAVYGFAAAGTSAARLEERLLESKDAPDAAVISDLRPMLTELAAHAAAAAKEENP